MSTIKFDNVSKKYKLYSKGGLYLRDRVSHVLARLNPFNSTNHTCDQSSRFGDDASAVILEREFWALRNVCFQIERGESVGFIGRNGAGKSTILKLLASVTKPSSGRIDVNGRVAALIEVGAGFHPELTGRENIFLNGSILGMRKAEIEKVLDSIVTFAEIEKFIDTPVKHYSSGMYVRLGFAIAVHTSPDIFLIDEVLAVGDEAFQKKCLNTLASHKKAGKTIILVSHDIAKVQEFCDRCIYLSQGVICYDGLPKTAISHYRKDVSRMLSPDTPGFGESLGLDAQIANVSFRDYQGNLKSTFCTGETLVIELQYKAFRRIDKPVFSFAVYGPGGEHVTTFNNRTSSVEIGSIEGEGAIFCRLKNLVLGTGCYSMSAAIHDFDCLHDYDAQRRRFEFEVICGEKYSEGFLYSRAEWASAVDFENLLGAIDDIGECQPIRVTTGVSE